MPTTYYYTINDRIIGESTNGVRTDYLCDALDSVTATVDQTGAVLNTYRYKPYGDLLAKTGTAPDPKFLWNGGSGYRATVATHSDYYVRARHFGVAEGAWTAIDPLWPTQTGYVYALAQATTRTDPSGLAVGLTITYLAGGMYECGCKIPALDCSKIGKWAISTKDTGWIVQRILSLWGLDPAGDH